MGNKSSPVSAARDQRQWVERVPARVRLMRAHRGLPTSPVRNFYFCSVTSKYSQLAFEFSTNHSTGQEGSNAQGNRPANCISTLQLGPPRMWRTTGSDRKGQTNVREF